MELSAGKMWSNDWGRLFALFMAIGAIGLPLVMALPHYLYGGPTIDSEAITVSTVLLAVVLVPPIEELIFRWLFRELLSPLLKEDTIWIWVSSLAYATMETINTPAVPSKFFTAFALGLALAYVYKRTGSIVSAIAAHAGFNAGILMFVGAVGALA